MIRIPFLRRKTSEDRQLDITQVIFRDGFDKGQTHGYDVGFADGYNEGYNIGRQEAIAEAKEAALRALKQKGIE